MKRRNLIFSKLRSDRQKYFNNERKAAKDKDLTTVPLVISPGGGCHDDHNQTSPHDEDISTQSSNSEKLSADFNDMHISVNKRTCFTSMVGLKQRAESSSSTASSSTRCLSSMVGSRPRDLDFPAQMVGSYDSTTKIKANENEPTTAATTAPSSKVSIKVAPPKTTRAKATRPITVTIPPNGIPESIITTTDDEKSVMSHQSTASKSIAATSKFRVVQVNETSDQFMASETESGYGSDCASTCSYSSVLSSATASSVYTDSSSLRDPCARKSRTVQRSKKLRKVGSDNDIWIEKIYMSKKTGKKRIYFVSVRTGERVRDEPPSGASQVLYAADLVHRKRDRHCKGPETIVLCNGKNTPAASNNV
eukprot:CAMPEP_0203735436 /NCGR_PEP_ID=MMETSP0092-20131115/32278_1 /ASSEMBLY_ACC=CAM_ASM_001090 /TAXON_ID=426623 /ORGANISM="Chaetoceros affinis, Strain CCMP159" /LENGTH=363 /DNA_ID=CAMNT_0050619979 /DNA_START=166 /DNA_END=1257 /DNA_ORIENTATION=+